MIALAAKSRAALFVPTAVTKFASARVAPAQSLDAALKSVIDGQQRSERNRVRDPFRHPAEVLSFLP